MTTADAFAVAVAVAAKGARRQLHAKGDSSALERQELHLKLEAADASSSVLKLAAVAAQQQHDTALAGLWRTVALEEARACDASREAEALQAAKAALQGRAASFDRNLQVQMKAARQVAGAARALEQLKAASAEPRHWSAHVESSERALEAAEQRAQVAEDERSAKAEELWERERRCKSKRKRAKWRARRGRWNSSRLRRRNLGTGARMWRAPRGRSRRRSSAPR